MPLLTAAWERRRDDDSLMNATRRMLELAVRFGTIPSEYMMYYFFTAEILAELQAKPTTRAQDILAAVPDYWTHYREQARQMCPEIDPARSRGGINELELAIDVMAAIFNDRPATLPVNVPNRGAIPDLDDDIVVETVGVVDGSGIVPLALGPLPAPAREIVQALAEYQRLAAQAAWRGDRRDAVRALAVNPLIPSFAQAEVIYDELAAAHQEYLPERLLRNAAPHA